MHTALMQVNERFSGQQLITSVFNILFPNRLAKGRNEDTSKESNNLLSLHSKILQKIWNRSYGHLLASLREDRREKSNCRID